jgi:hypothetical protein
VALKKILYKLSTWFQSKVQRCNGIGIPPKNVMDNVIVTRELQVERKHFYIEFRENERGRFMRITEEAHGRRNTIIIPSTGLDEFMSAAGEVIQSADRVPAAS